MSMSMSVLGKLPLALALLHIAVGQTNNNVNKGVYGVESRLDESPSLRLCVPLPRQRWLW